MFEMFRKHTKPSLLPCLLACPSSAFLCLGVYKSHLFKNHPAEEVLQIRVRAFLFFGADMGQGMWHGAGSYVLENQFETQTKQSFQMHNTSLSHIGV